MQLLRSDEAQSPHAQAQVLPASKALLLLEVHTDGLSSTSRDGGIWPSGASVSKITSVIITIMWMPHYSFLSDFT